MKKRNCCIIFAVCIAIPFGVFWKGGFPFLDEAKKAIRIELSIQNSISNLKAQNSKPQNDERVLGFELSSFPAFEIPCDLDVRDKDNLPLRDRAQKAFLNDLFIENLYQLRVIQSEHSFRAAIEGLNLYLALFLSVFFHPSDGLRWALEQAILPTKKKLVHKVHNLWITFSVESFGISSLLCQYRPLGTPLRLNLRC